MLSASPAATPAAYTTSAYVCLNHLEFPLTRLTDMPLSAYMIPPAQQRRNCGRLCIYLIAGVAGRWSTARENPKRAPRHPRQTLALLEAKHTEFTLATKVFVDMGPHYASPKVQHLRTCSKELISGIPNSASNKACMHQI